MQGSSNIVMSSEIGSTPAEIAGAIGDFRTRMMRIAAAVANRIGRIPLPMLRIRIVPTSPVSSGVSTNIPGALAQVPCGRLMTSWARAPSSGKRM